MPFARFCISGDRDKTIQARALRVQTISRSDESVDVSDHVGWIGNQVLLRVCQGVNLESWWGESQLFPQSSEILLLVQRIADQLWKAAFFVQIYFSSMSTY